MRKLLLPTAVLAGLAACQAGPTPAPRASNVPGAPTPQAAVQRFLAAAHAQNLQDMGAVWGTAEGAARDHMDRAQLERREVVLQCYFDADSARILGVGAEQNQRRMVRVQLTRGPRVRTTSFFTVRGPANRWYVENMDIAAVRDFCGSQP